MQVATVGSRRPLAYRRTMMTSEPHASTPEVRLKRLHERLGGIAYGGDYNPEQWPRRCGRRMSAS